MVSGIDHFDISVTNAKGQTAGPYRETPSPATIPPDHEYALGFGSSVDGTVTVRVDAVGAAQDVLASGSASASVKPSESGVVTVTLSGSQQSDGGAADGAGSDGPFFPLDAGTAKFDGGYVLRAGGIGTVGPAVSPAATIRLSDDGFELGDRACAGALCATGGITP